MIVEFGCVRWSRRTSDGLHHRALSREEFGSEAWPQFTRRRMDTERVSYVHQTGGDLLGSYSPGPIAAVTGKVRWLFQQSPEAGLLEMRITRERIGKPVFAHGDKREAVGERPALVRPGDVKPESLIE
jgi:hypothetical protein